LFCARKSIFLKRQTQQTVESLKTCRNRRERNIQRETQRKKKVRKKFRKKFFRCFIDGIRQRKMDGIMVQKRQPNSCA
jgi:hypothetical protein